MSETIRVLSRVSASFRLPDGGVFDILPAQRWQLLEVPAGIRKDPLFGWLLQDGSLEVAGRTAPVFELENEPGKGVTAEGKKPRRNAAANGAAWSGRAAGTGGASGRNAVSGEAGEGSPRNRSVPGIGSSETAPSPAGLAG